MTTKNAPAVTVRQFLEMLDKSKLSITTEDECIAIRAASPGDLMLLAVHMLKAGITRSDVIKLAERELRFADANYDDLDCYDEGLFDYIVWWPCLKLAEEEAELLHECQYDVAGGLTAEARSLLLG